jgi:hypothetical protein
MNVQEKIHQQITANALVQEMYQLGELHKLVDSTLVS